MSSQLESVSSLLEELQAEHELSLLKLSEPLLTQPNGTQKHQEGRVSDASSKEDGGVQPTPASLDADLVHYQELFTKLRFSYVEQVTKEKTLRNLVSDPPTVVDAATNTELEASLKPLKASLRAQKAAVSELLAEIERLARHVARRHAFLDEQTSQLAQIPDVVAELRGEIARMREEQGIGQEGGEEPTHLRLGLRETVKLVEESEERLEKLDERLDELQEQRARKEAEFERIRTEARNAEVERDQATKGAGDARRKRAGGNAGVDNELEARGRWLRGVEGTMKALLEVEG